MSTRAMLFACWIVTFGMVAATVACAPAPVPVDERRPDPGTVVGSPRRLASYPALYTSTSRAERVEYSSRGPAGEPTVVSGALLVPRGEPPPDGWPIVSYAHAGDGGDPACAPSLSPDLRGALDELLGLVSRGYVVVATDYQRSSARGPHPYLDVASSSANLVDAARAAVASVPGASNRWFAVGVSQGGHAAWAANERATDSELRLLGSVSLAPQLDMTDVATDAARGSLSPERVVLFPTLVDGASSTDPSVVPDNLYRGTLSRRTDAAAPCLGDSGAVGTDDARAVPAADYAPATDEDRVRLTAALDARRLPRSPATAPALVAFGGRDSVTSPERTRAAVRAACARGDRVTVLERPDDDHRVGISPEVLDWITALRSGATPRPTCGPEPTSPTSTGPE
ncbi:alpha/beta hydrolase [Rhodococcus rhodnii]|uniref:Lipase n=2 Tax=Rhodococcus rhodnii TaxID=38312 RepID=R7WQS7_9NOCA|nr:alpha/beta hydrolase [Rhodococcus rhodnii]EOM77671.1 hypothetical protein Rrhod_0963 [Rhodococcus rhodnii LMG 5362]TXG90102.1 alpha/beta hydrolase [Rhodococcus rhodnii]